MKKYIGITIGPVFETMSLSSSPVALWASSYIFSLLSKTLCEVLVQDGVEEKNIVSPYFSVNEPLYNKNDGIGMFHDRIIFNAENYDILRLGEVKEKALKIIAQSFGVSMEYIKEYIMIAAAEFEADNPILESGKILDSLELATPFVAKEDTNPILSMFSGNKYSKNSSLKNTELIKSLTKFQLKKDEDSFISIPEIVRKGKEYKKYEYYAIVRSDGDNMSKIIASLADDEQIRDFSEKCLKYCSDIADKVAEFGGITIYSGGDDLLAILPCENENSLTPFHFIREANDCFSKTFSAYNAPVSLSFGIMMAYHKYPLYEALENSATLLFGFAKKDEKNCAAVQLQKHSGQSYSLIIPNSRIADIIDLLEYMRESKASEQQKEKVFFSASRKLALFKELFDDADDAATLTNLFVNTFDAEAHKGNIFLENELPSFYQKLKQDVRIKAIDSKGIQINEPTLTMSSVLLMLKFFFEKGGE